MEHTHLEQNDPADTGRASQGFGAPSPSTEAADVLKSNGKNAVAGAREAAERGKDKLADEAQGVARALHQASEGLRSDDHEELARCVKRAVGHTAHQAIDKFDQLVLGAVAVGVGLAVGLGLPAIDSESKLIGDYRQRLVDNAKQRVSSLGEVAGRAADAAQNTVKQELSPAAEQSAAQ